MQDLFTQLTDDIQALARQLDEVRTRTDNRNRVIAILSLAVGMLAIVIMIILPIVGSSISENKTLAVIAAKSGQAISLQSIGKFLGYGSICVHVSAERSVCGPLRMLFPSWTWLCSESFDDPLVSVRLGTAA